MEFKLYRIKPEYLKYIQQFDEHVLRKDMRPYIAVCINISGHLYALPITSKRLRNNGRKRNSLTTTELITKNEKDSGAILYNNMIPVTYDVIQRIDLNNESAVNRESLSKKINIIRKTSARIKEKAENLYRLRSSEQNDFINGFCCDFKLLEQKLSEYVVQQEKINTVEKPDKAGTDKASDNEKQRKETSDRLPTLSKLLSEAKQKANEINQNRQRDLNKKHNDINLD